MVKQKQQTKGNSRGWILPTVLILVMVICVGGYYFYSLYERNLAEQTRQSSEQASLEAELAGMRHELEIDQFYDGIFVGDIGLSGKTLEEAKTLFGQQDATWRTAFSVNLQFGEQTWPFTAANTVLTSDWEAVLDEAWQIGRTSDEEGEEAQLRDRYATIQALRQKPIHLEITQSFDAQILTNKIVALAATLYNEPVPASVTGFDMGSKNFVIEEKKDGRLVDGAAAAEAARALLAKGQYGQTVVMEAQVLDAGEDAATIQSHLGLVSDGVTYARSVNTPRDHNIKLICQMLNGLVLQPGETFSFNGYIGERTPEKGFQMAGGIRDGVLIPEYGGGICQPNTTLCQAVLKADLEIIERHPHSWPSDYVPVGLDATVSWEGPDFKFLNNTEYPIVLVAWYSKPKIVVQIYGRLFEPGVSISLSSVVTQTTPAPDPVETFNPELAPGARVEIRAAHIGQSAVAYKVWKKDGKVIKKEVAFESKYRALSAIYEYGEPLPTPTPTVTPTPPEPSPEPSVSVTPEASPTAGG